MTTSDCGSCRQPMVHGRCQPGQRQHEARGLCRQCYWRAHNHTRPRARSGHPAGPHGTRQETRERYAEIARLTAAGRSAHDIAITLRTTERTVLRARRKVTA